MKSFHCQTFGCGYWGDDLFFGPRNAMIKPRVSLSPECELLEARSCWPLGRVPHLPSWGTVVESLSHIEPQLVAQQQNAVIESVE